MIVRRPSATDLSTLAGLTHLGAHLQVLEPGQASSDLHHHAASDELVFVVAGTPTVLDDAGAHTLQPGDLACWPAGSAVAHRVINRSGAPCTLLVIGSRTWRDTVTYPELRRVLHIVGYRWQIVEGQRVVRGGVHPTTASPGRGMLHHLSLPVRDLQASARMYDAALGALGYDRVDTAPGFAGYGQQPGKDELALKHDPAARNAGPRFHVALAAHSDEAVAAFHAAATSHGATCDGPPGLRPHYGPTYVAAYVIDLDGHRLEAVHKGRLNVAG